MQLPEPRIYPEDLLLTRAEETLGHLLSEQNHIQQQIQTQQKIIQHRKNFWFNEYCFELRCHLPESLTSLVLVYMNMQYCALHDTYFPPNWEYCMLCLPQNDDPTKCLLYGNGEITINARTSCLQFSQVDEVVKKHIFKTAELFPVYVKIEKQVFSCDFDIPLALCITRSKDSITIYIRRQKTVSFTGFYWALVTLDIFTRGIVIKNTKNVRVESYPIGP